ncbi:hypothetical protein FOZG_13498 [Fusarium oxysporum Fo47]|uniref:Uncharacterized protein n=1 Tax=Fusarium oxysporum Fo47 TaxID=660027 RepID=W9JTG4_FUSOX|nr:hypothetical protein FOZG_13498 [Fusarium oxysporum Fo47]
MSYPAVLVPAGGTPVDHLSIPRRPTHNPHEMAFLGQELTFDGGSFIGYPSRKGWAEKDVYESGSSGKSREEIVGFFQILFFWGLLEDTLRIRIHESNLAKENALGQQVISTRDLPGLVQRWYDREQYLSVKAQTKHAKRVNKNLWHMCNILSWWDLYGIPPFDQSDLLYLVMFGEYLQTSYKTARHPTSLLIIDVGPASI